jgi:Glyoxalase-like domain
MSATIDHLVYACPDLDATCGWVAEATGVAPAPGGPHPGLGTRNALLSLGARTYVELIGPDPEQPAPDQPRPFGVDWLRLPSLRAWAAGSGNIMMALASTERFGHRLSPPVEGRRRTPEGQEISWRMARAEPLAIPGPEVLPFLIDWGDSPHPATTSPAGLAVEGYVLGTPAPRQLQEMLEALGVEGPWEVVASPAPALRAEIIGPTGQRIILAS